MSKHYFTSKFRTIDFEDLPGVVFRNFEYRTDDDEIAAKLRAKRDIFEVTAALGANAKIAKPEEVAEAQKHIEAAAEGAPKVVGGMRTSETKDTKEKKTDEKVPVPAAASRSTRGRGRSGSRAGS